ncbi:gluconate 2-dehydrogenase subunit 3 family protein [Pedobacter gandavensis]|uniref:gluconate 2-dehydrogenase subunit 3 family protein n=1 Tax=Pedobacter gandavensis TaxID=2679963 RepID=UPI00293192E2|nr:gluconate 2-dehydrogenase subunit 3 family protein [Pedobacter gandavensis]
MNRRLAIKQVLIFAGGMALLPSCLREEGKVSIQLKNLDISAAQENLLAEIAELIIPKTDTSGAKDLKLHLFVLKMLDDCYEPADQQQFIAGLKTFENKEGKALAQLVLDANSDKSGTPEEVSKFYKIMKSRTIGGYLNSKYVMSNLLVWELVPGRYNGYFRVKSA